jgi:hypothetical protein
MLTDMDTEQVVDQVVGRDTGEVMNLVVQGNTLSAPREINGVGDKDMLVIAKCVTKLQVPLYAQGIGLDLRILACGRRGVYDGLRAVRRNAQTDGTIVGDIESVAVTRVMRHKAEGSVRIGDWRLEIGNCRFHSSGLL